MIDCLYKLQLGAAGRPPKANPAVDDDAPQMLRYLNMSVSRIPVVCHVPEYTLQRASCNVIF